MLRTRARVEKKLAEGRGGQQQQQQHRRAGGTPIAGGAGVNSNSSPVSPLAGGAGVDSNSSPVSPHEGSASGEGRPASQRQYNVPSTSNAASSSPPQQPSSTTTTVQFNVPLQPLAASSSTPQQPTSTRIVQYNVPLNPLAASSSSPQRPSSGAYQTPHFPPGGSTTPSSRIPAAAQHPNSPARKGASVDGVPIVDVFQDVTLQGGNPTTGGGVLQWMDSNSSPEPQKVRF